MSILKLFFDAGATYYLDQYSSSMKWLVDTYLNQGIKFDRLIAWEKEKLTQKQIDEGVPDWLRPGYEFYNHGIEVHPKSAHNPLNFIKKNCKKSDFVVFKLDIDSKHFELDLIRQLFLDRKAMDLIDDFYYEDHFNNNAMRIHGWLRYSNSLEEYYNVVIAQRQRGLRMHYWP